MVSSQSPISYGVGRESGLAGSKYLTEELPMTATNNRSRTAHAPATEAGLTTLDPSSG
jgi:hypothetical protein